MRIILNNIYMIFGICKWSFETSFNKKKKIRMTENKNIFFMIANKAVVIQAAVHLSFRDKGVVKWHKTISGLDLFEA